MSYKTIEELTAAAISARENGKQFFEGRCGAKIEKVYCEEFRWVVWWVNGDGKDDYQLITRTEIDPFVSEAEALIFAETKVIKKAKDYFQPTIYKQQKVKITEVHVRWEEKKEDGV